MNEMRSQEHAKSEIRGNKNHKPIRKRFPQVRLAPARGAGSIHCHSDVLQLVKDGLVNAAIEMVREHKRACGEQLYSESVMNIWIEQHG